MKRRYGVGMLLAIAAFVVLGCSKSESAQQTEPATNPEPQATAPAPPAEGSAPQASAQQEGDAAAAVPASDMVYVCDMGCEVVDHPGKCSKCGMTLKEVNKADISYVCETCGFMTEMPGACPKDHTILVLKIKENKG